MRRWHQIPQRSDMTRWARTGPHMPFDEESDATRAASSSGSPTADASDAYSKHIQELGPTLLCMTLSR